MGADRFVGNTVTPCVGGDLTGDREQIQGEQGKEHGGQLHEHGGQPDPDAPVDQEVYEMISKASERMMQDGES